MNHKEYAKKHGIGTTIPDPEFELWEEFLAKFPIFKNRAYTEDTAQKIFKFFYSKMK